MREPKKQLQNLYRYQPVEVRRTRGGRPHNPEEENERCYELIHIKLAPRRLRMLSLLNTILLVSILLVLFAGALLLPKPTESKLEKRELAKKPAFSLQSLFSGKFSRETETYFSDTFPLREWFVSLAATINENHGIRFDDVRVVAPSNDTDMNTAEPIASSAEQDISGPKKSGPESDDSLVSGLDASLQSSPIDENAVGIVNNGTFICQGRAMSLYGGSHESARRYASVLNSYVKELPDVRIYNMIIPTAAEFYLPQKYKSMSRSQREVIDLIYGMLDPSVKKVDAYDALAAHTNEYLYFRTDHHWTGRGAYYAYTAFCKQAGFTPLSMKDFETRRLDDFIGTLYAQAPDSTLLAEPDYVEYYLFDRPYTAVRYDRGRPYTPVPHNLWGEYAKSPNSYSVFLQGDFPLIAVDTGIHNGRKIMLVKESYGNAFAPFLINHYEKVYIVDQRYFERPILDFIAQEGINELLFANNAFAVCTPTLITSIENLRYATVYTPPKRQQPVVSQPEESVPEAMTAAEIPKENSEPVSQPERPAKRERPKVEKPETANGLLKPREPR